MKGWGSDIVLFFPFDLINAALTNPKVTNHVDGRSGRSAPTVCGTDVRYASGEPRGTHHRRIRGGAAERGYSYIIPYVFEYEQEDRTSHYLIFVTKHPLGYGIMKNIMYKASEDKNQGIARFGYVRSESDKTPLLSLLNRPLDDLCDDFDLFAGRKLTMEATHREHQALGINPFVEKNYKDALNMLDAVKKITTSKPNRRKGTFADDIVVTFPKKENK